MRIDPRPLIARPAWRWPCGPRRWRWRLRRWLRRPASSSRSGRRRPRTRRECWSRTEAAAVPAWPRPVRGHCRSAGARLVVCHGTERGCRPGDPAMVMRWSPTGPVARVRWLRAPGGGFLHRVCTTRIPGLLAGALKRRAHAGGRCRDGVVIPCRRRIVRDRFPRAAEAQPRADAAVADGRIRRLGASSQPGQGTRFTLTLPRAVEPQAVR